MITTLPVFLRSEYSLIFTSNMLHNSIIPGKPVLRPKKSQERQVNFPLYSGQRKVKKGRSTFPRMMELCNVLLVNIKEYSEN